MIEIDKSITYSGVYQIVNKINNKSYIGSAINIHKRITEHRNDLNRKKHHSIKLQRAYDKYDNESFVVVILEIVDKNKLKISEQMYLDRFKPEYNMLKIVGSRVGVEHTEESKKRIGASLKGRRPWNKGIRYTEEQKEALRRNPGNKGKYNRTDVMRKNMSLSQIGNSNAKGHTCTEEARAQMSISAKIRCTSDAGRTHIAKLAAEKRKNTG